MAKTKVLITVKTYPTPSTKYHELVCTAGLREDGSWIRIFPVPFRKLDFASQYKKYEWIELDLVKNDKDPRAESFRPTNIDEIQRLGYVDTEKGTWRTRKEIINKGKIYTNFQDLIAEAHDKKKWKSLATFRPTEIHDFIVEPAASEWKKKKVEDIEEQAKQLSRLSSEDPIPLVEKVPWKFSYKFSDETGKKRTLMIEDWEVCELYRNCLKASEGDEAKAVKGVIQKYKDDFIQNKDLLFFVGTLFEHHVKNAPNPFVIIGAFYPKKQAQLTLDGL